MSDLRDFRGPLPLSDEDFAQVRAKVRADLSCGAGFSPRSGARTEVRATRGSVIWLRMVAAVAAMLAIVILGALLLRPHAPIPIAAKPATTPHPRFAVPLPAPRGEGASGASPSPRASGERVAAGRVRGHATRHHTPHHHQPTHVAVRLELQTADPDVRIIWIE